jgi:hypothetical protein
MEISFAELARADHLFCGENTISVSARSYSLNLFGLSKPSNIGFKVLLFYACKACEYGSSRILQEKANKIGYFFIVFFLSKYLK